MTYSRVTEPHDTEPYWAKGSKIDDDTLTHDQCFEALSGLQSGLVRWWGEALDLFGTDYVPEHLREQYHLLLESLGDSYRDLVHIRGRE